MSVIEQCKYYAKRKVYVNLSDKTPESLQQAMQTFNIFFDIVGRIMFIFQIVINNTNYIIEDTICCASYVLYDRVSGANGWIFDG